MESVDNCKRDSRCQWVKHTGVDADSDTVFELDSSSEWVEHAGTHADAAVV